MSECANQVWCNGPGSDQTGKCEWPRCMAAQFNREAGSATASEHGEARRKSKDGLFRHAYFYAQLEALVTEYRALTITADRFAQRVDELMREHEEELANS